MENDLNEFCDRLLEDSRYLQSIGAPIENSEELREWTDAYRRALEIPEGELRERMHGIMQRALEQVKREERQGLEVAATTRMVQESPVAWSSLVEHGRQVWAACLERFRPRRTVFAPINQKGDSTCTWELELPSDLPDSVRWAASICLQAEIHDQQRSMRQYNVKVALAESRLILPDGAASLRVTLLDDCGYEESVELNQRHRMQYYEGSFASEASRLHVRVEVCDIR